MRDVVYPLMATAADRHQIFRLFVEHIQIMQMMRLRCMV
jgi:hypothetical protein